MAEGRRKVEAPPVYTLYTNISYVKIGAVRTYCHALLLTQNEACKIFKRPDYTLRGFGMEAAWPVFDFVLQPGTLPLELHEHRVSGPVMMSHDGAMTPLFTGFDLRLKDGTVVELYMDDPERPLDVAEFGEDDINKAWAAMWEKTAEYWRRPYMPRLLHAPAKSHPLPNTYK